MIETFTTNILRIIEFILALGVLIFLHELGHYLFARLFKIEVEEFGFGFPPRIVKLFTLGGTDFTLNWIPFGAFVRPKGENDPSTPGGMAAAPPWHRLFILLGGPLMNLIAGILLFSVVFKTMGAPVANVVQIISVNPGSPAEQAGLLPQDIFVSVNDHPIHATQDLSELVSANLGKNITITVKRGDQLVIVQAIPRLNPPPGEGPLGIIMGSPVRPVSWSESIPLALQSTYNQARTLISLPVQLLRGQVSPDQARVVGPKGMYDIYNLARTEDQKVDQSNPSGLPIRTISLMAIISVALGMTNLLPIPALDGGRILFVLPEILFRRRVPAKYENMVHLIGFATLIILMILITAQDIFNPIQLR
ncbi:predicted membrane-associated Zn-dependent proteases 1 [Anaerolinea thermolimosa]|uniref:M50 family metallopeptidase n=1 Tax=Anaerolinea thermolimosa TaxID=229919 RepID=UPI0007810375|nr:M50 family metallopeptidase [Anaerolinea thermolimosa]GAP06741.1 predicted membrane-associated Zn-dependent proteases 1 [Anaerolinea thermolimosa]